METSVLKKARAVLSKDEGFKNTAYQDSKGNWTIGVGHFIGKDLQDLKLSDYAVLFLLSEDINSHWQIAIEIFSKEFLDLLSPARQVAILTMTFTLGHQFKKFNNTIAAIKRHDWKRAAEGVLDSKWAKDVDVYQRKFEGRDDRVAQMFLNGEFPKYYGITEEA